SLCTINIVYARSGFSEPLVACLIMLAVLAIFNYLKNNSLSALIASGSCIGYTIFIKKNSIILLPAFLVFLFYIILKNRKGLVPRLLHAAVFLLPIAISALAIVLQNRILYGGLSNTEFGTIGDMLGKVRTDSFPIKGLYYYLISSGKGILIYNIAMGMGFFAIKNFLKKYRVMGVFLLALMLSNLAFYSFIFTRGSIFSWGPRYLFPVLPLMTVFLAEFISKGNAAMRKAAVLSFALLGFMIQLPGLIMNFSRYIFFVKEKLLLPEYLMDFMPELSPIKGMWALFVSMLNRGMRGESLSFLYNPDFLFVASAKASLSGYDYPDIWWVNIIRACPAMGPYVLIGAMIIVLAIALSRKSINSSIRKQRADD
ncbi:MAG: hypothetical protein Q8O01_07730, partial [Candidatus Omnitrophota bacterium]|nr:hypothetical protein [Candidatus Omnitrophota bacterium]